MSRFYRRISARDLDGNPGPFFIVKHNKSGPTPIFLSAPHLSLLDESTALELAHALADAVEEGRNR